MNSILSQKENLKEFIINNVPNKIDYIEILFGKKINYMMFNTRLNVDSKNKYDIVPIINSMLFNFFIKKNNPLLFKHIANSYAYTTRV